MAQVKHVVMGTVPYLSSTGAHSDWGMVGTATLSLPNVWWHLHANGAPTLLRDLAAQVFSLVPTDVRVRKTQFQEAIPCSYENSQPAERRQG
jgi:hypothetical protein